MKTVQDPAELKRLALAKGASVEIGGRMINAQGARMSVVAPKPQAAPETPPAPAPDPLPQPDVVGAIERVGLMLAGALRAQAPQSAPEPMAAAPAAPAPAPKRDWVFEVKQDDDDLMTSVVATSTDGEQTISFSLERGERKLVKRVYASQS